MKRILRLGDKLTLRKTFTQQEVIDFSKISTDVNPLHLSPEYVRQHGVFKGTIVHGILLGSLFSAMAGNTLPGPGSIYLSYFFFLPHFINFVTVHTVHIYIYYLPIYLCIYI